LTGERKPYRFLLRMSEELRERLVEAAARSGKSINREIVERLEASLAEDLVDREPERALASRALRPLQIGGHMTRRRRHGLTAVAVGLVAATALFAAALLGGGVQSSSGFTLKGNAKFEAGEPNELRSPDEINGPIEQTSLSHAYPEAASPLAAVQHAREAWGALSARSGKTNQAGTWQLIGPDKATYPSVLTPFIMGGAQYVAAGRTTALAIAPTCEHNRCRLYLGAAGGGVWRTDKALGGANWEYVGQALGTNAIGSLLVDPRDASGNTVYAGTGESHASGDSEAGVGIYKTTNGGDTWSLVADSSIFFGRAISSLALAPDGTLYAGVARAVRGVSSVTGGATSNPPVAAALGLYKLAPGGASFSMIWNGNGSVRGPTDIEIDPSNPSILYSGAYQQGVWRSTNGGTSFSQILPALNPAENTDRPEIAAAKLANGKTRLYVGIGSTGAPGVPASFFRTEDATAAAPSFTNLSAAPLPGGNSDIATTDYCTGQCWYDNFVYTPKGYPDVVYLGGSWLYPEVSGVSNGRGVVLSTDGGKTWSDVSRDAGPVGNADSLHPDQHALVTNPNDPLQWIEGSDGGVMRADHGYEDASAQCDGRGLNAAGIARCKSLLWRVPKELANLNNGLSTLQFQSLSVSPKRSGLLMGGTQDNGTFEFHGSANVWPQIIYGDGGQSGFNAADDGVRFNSFFGQFHDANFRNGDPTKWVIISGDIAASPEGSNFYAPIVPDPHPAKAGSIFQGSQSVWRTQDWGGDRDYLEANCPEFTTSGTNTACGDFERIGPAGATDLTASAADYRGTTRAGGFVAAIERATSNTGTMWVATTTGRVFVSQNANDAAASVTYTRLDTLAANDPNRFVSSIYIDPANPNHAWLSYSGYSAVTPATPGHVFEVTYNPGAGTATWANLDGGTGPMGDLPVTDLVRDDVTGTLYASTDFGVAKLSGGAWALAGGGMPMVEVAGLTIVPGDRVLYAATHGRSAWSLRLP
jgi:hypothetical protein